MYFSNKSEFSLLPAIESFFPDVAILSSKLSFLAHSESEEKCTPRARTASCGHLKPKGFSVRLFHVPNHMASVLLVLICRPLTFLNSSKSFNNLGTESQSCTRTVVSSAYCVIFLAYINTFDIRVVF